MNPLSNVSVSVNGARRIRPGRRLSLRQVLDFQNITHEAAKGLGADFQGTADRELRVRGASSIANLGKAWVSLQDAKLEILGRPKADVLKPEGHKCNRRRLRRLELPDPVPIESPAPPEKPPEL